MPDFNNYNANSAGRQFQAGFNLFSNPVNWFGNLGSGQGQSYVQSGTAGTLTNPFGIDFTGGEGSWNQSLSQNKGVFDSMTPDDWKAFSHMTTADQNAFVTQRDTDVKNKQTQADKDKAAADQEAQYQQWRSQVMGQLQTFANKMNMTPDQLIKSGDYGAMTAQTAGIQQGGKAALAGGMSGGGGLSNLNTQKAAMDSVGAYAWQRQQVGAQTLNNLQQGLGSMAHDAEATREYNQGLNLQLQQAANAQYMAKYQQQQGQQSGLFGLAGGIIGGMYGGPGGAQAGSSIGQGVGGMGYQSQNPYNPPGYSYPSQTGGGLGGYKPYSYNPNGQ